MDLEVPEDFKPVNADGEAESFQLLPIEKVSYLSNWSNNINDNGLKIVCEKRLFVVVLIRIEVSSIEK